MKISVRMFAIAGQLADSGMVDVELPPGAKVSDLRRAMVAQLPVLSALMKHFMIAVDNDYATDDTPLHETSEVACIPPVSGG